MATVKINVNVDSETKLAAEKLLSEIGLTMTAAINIYLKRMLLEGRIPFEVGLNNPNAVTVAAMEEYYEMKRDPQKYKRYSSFAEIWDEARKDV